VGPGERIDPVEPSFLSTVTLGQWRTATLVASGIAALELAVLLVIGVAVLGKSAARHVQAAAYAKVVHDATAPRAKPARKAKPAAPKLSRSRTSVVVLNGSGITGAAGMTAARLRGRGYRIAAVGNARSQSSSARTLVMYRSGFRPEASRLARDVGSGLVTPLDGMRRRALDGAQVVLVVGA
jgi:LytR cell envelope-related transcriptional attenuator